MRSVLLTVVGLWGCLMLLQPVILAQQAKGNTGPRQDPGTPDEDGSQSSSLNSEVFYPKKYLHDNNDDDDVGYHPKNLHKRSVDSRSGNAIYGISVFGKEMLVNLTRFSEFLYPGLIFQRTEMNYSWFEDLADSGLDRCFYSGTVDGIEDSHATFSLCKGMMGMIHLPQEKYIIEPLKNSSSTNNMVLEHRPHIIHKYPIINHQHSTTAASCTVSENYKHQRLKRDTIRRYSTSQSSSSYNVNNNNYENNKNNDNSIYHKRRKRSASLKRFVETLVVVDDSMRRYHKEDLKHYVLTLMAMVTNIYKHPSIGNFINIVVVKILEPGPADLKLKITENAAMTLKDFCKWQKDANEQDVDHPNHHDTAILLTRKDICRALGKCDTLGLAELGTICDPVRSCAIIEDNGISAAYTIAHELGHVFNLPHDDDKQCLRYPQSIKSKKKYHVMAPTLDYNSSPWDWSPCSARLMTEYIDAGLAECLLDRPQTKKFRREMTLTQLQSPGQLYGVDKQCELVFGSGYVLCPHMQTCERLWCTNKTSSGCRTQHMPWADGTECKDVSRNKLCRTQGCWCRSGECVLRIPLKARNGGWGKWQDYGPCSRTCGGGIKTSIRQCNNPLPDNGGKYCLGKRIKYRSCNTKICLSSKLDFREEQCANFSNRYHIDGLPSNVKWVPKYTGVQMKDSCKLYCQAESTSSFYQLAETVIDGTKCRPDTDDICVNGKCRRAGCDNRLGSNMKRDRCGVCGGDNSSCKSERGRFNNAKYGYNKVITVPSGATNIEILQHGYQNTSNDWNYLSLRNSKGEYILNGDHIVRTQKWSIKVQNGYLEYSGVNVPVERINSTRMIGEDISVEVLSVGSLLPPDVRYTYTVSAPKDTKFRWDNLGMWKRCSHLCQGLRKRKIVCIRENDFLIVSNKHCVGKAKPPRLRDSCNTDCYLRWKVMRETECSVHCGKGIKTRTVHCVKETNKASHTVDDRHCRHLGAKPHTNIMCEGKCSATMWNYAYWSKCTKTCGGGNQTREAQCVNEDAHVVDNRHCEDKHKEPLVQSCNEVPCAQWRSGAWTGCSVSCGSGKRHRDVWCGRGEDKVEEHLCDKKNRPESKKECLLEACPEWYAGGWGPCSVTCGVGEKMRTVICRTFTGNIVEDAVCDASKRPRDKSQCYIGPCPTLSPPTTPTTPSYLLNSHWRFGIWTECSTTCGPGVQHRYVSCMNNRGHIMDNTMCNPHHRPASKQDCNNKACGIWRKGEWSTCPVTCGTGSQTRYVACIVLDNETSNQKHMADYMCDADSKPDAKKNCNMGDCHSIEELDIAVITSNTVEKTSHWRVGPWGPCSTTCNEGHQGRLVVCQDENGPSDSCDERVKPDERKICNSGPCPSWNQGQWAECSSPCGLEGQQSRAVRCQLPNGQILADSNCDVFTRPTDARLCSGECNSSSNQWRTEPWSSCSATCGSGQRQRVVVCVDQAGNTQPTTTCSKKMPRNTKRCARGHCPHWNKGRWSKCSVSCGVGVKRREVKCMISRRDVVDAEQCQNATKPQTTIKCHRKTCLKFKWKPGIWSECSKTCGFGRKERSVTCTDRLGTAVSSHLCDNDRKPKVRRRCSEFPCPFIWNTGPWSECTSTCSEGKQIRTVVCQSVTREGWILPGQVPHRCPITEKPTRVRYCNYGDCNADYRWRVGPWGQCTVRCGHGKQRRMIKCVDKKGRRKSKRRCVRLYRPESSRACYNGPCYARSCKELKEITTIRVDGEYKLMVDRKLITIYCNDMRKSLPHEYLTLPNDRHQNYAEMFDHRLRNPASCPNNGTRPQVCTRCRRKPYKQAGSTTYSKVRIDLNTLKILPTDGTFSNVHSGKLIPYGTAGDCYSSKACPQGLFSINLTGTGLTVSENTTWTLEGNKASQRIWRLRDGEIIRGVCGGYCGVCSPDPRTGLHLQVLH
ncbi:A disintegrin and metalloproteinase with thrombospondin motifs 9-like [Haliotis rubra]|uniref:A disintegrin and metalloproteinase with thrombospondin motifs 9-like n=1 Tax=Haliotis rubra TaxID=36100 RepID=UPI001EE5FB77|nr:A disintegrin and metalloproteinase with thrombospondin motifs 9-like [Haliotis rubra]